MNTRRGDRFGAGLLTASISKSEKPGVNVRYVVGKRIGGAVVRNRVKRVLREAFRSAALTGNRLGIEIAFFPRSAAAGESLNKTKQDMAKILKDAGLL